MKRLLSLCLAALFCASVAFAQLPRTISYQGILTDGSGNFIPDGPHSLVLKIYDSFGAASPIYTETQNVPVIKGIFNVIIGSVTAIPASVSFDRAYYLGVSVDGGAEMNPRTPMTAAPYAMRAAVADKAMSLDPSVTGVVTSLNGISGPVTLQGGGSTIINQSGSTITISSTGGSGGSGIQGVQNTDGTITITNPTGPIATMNITDGSISNNKLGANSVTSDKILDGGVQTGDIADAAIITTKLNDGSVTGTKLAANAVTTDKIADGGVQTADLADGSVTAPKVNSGSSTNGQVLMSNGSGAATWQNPPVFTLPYTNTMNNASDLFAITNSGTARAGYFRNTNTTPNQSALYGEANNTSASLVVAGVEGKSTNGFGIIGRGGSGAAGMFGLVITGPTAGAFYAGTGVNGFSDAGYGVAGITYNASSAGVYGTANGTGTGVKGSSTSGKAGLFENTTAANTSDALTGSTNGSGNGVYGTNTATTGSTSGILGEAASTSHGIGATGGVTGVLGRVTPTTPGGYSAGVRGINNGTSGTGIGVIGYQAGSGWGVYGETPSGFGVYGLSTNNSAASVGVRGETFSTNGIAVEAKYSGTGVGIALEVDNGAIRVAGVNKAAFVHTATPANKLSANGTDITNPLCDGDANCILIVTQKLNPSGIVYNNSPIGVYYNTVRAKWEIFNENNVAIPNNAQFNVLVIKQ